VNPSSPLGAHPAATLYLPDLAKMLQDLEELREKLRLTEAARVLH
jgi:hypothetical protein